MQRKAGSSGRHRRAVPGQAESVQRVSKSVFLPIIIRRKSLAFRFFPDSGNCSRQAPEKGILSHHVLPRQVRTGAENTTSSNRVFKCPSIAAAANLPCPAGNRLWRPSCCPSAVRASAMPDDGSDPAEHILISPKVRRRRTEEEPCDTAVFSARTWTRGSGLLPPCMGNGFSYPEAEQSYTPQGNLCDYTENRMDFKRHGCHASFPSEQSVPVLLPPVPFRGCFHDLYHWQ